MWEKEEKMIKGLGKLYPRFVDKWEITIKYEDYNSFNYDKAMWVYLLCAAYLKQRILTLEGYIKTHCQHAWTWYKIYFGVKN